MNAKEFLKDVYEKELMSGSPIPQDEWMEMLEDDSWLNLTLKAMEAYHRAKVEEVTDAEIDGQSTKYTDEMEYAFRRGAKWIRNKLLNQ